MFEIKNKNAIRRRHCRRSGALAVAFEQILHLFLVFLWLTWNKKMYSGLLINLPIFLWNFKTKLFNFFAISTIFLSESSSAVAVTLSCVSSTLAECGKFLSNNSFESLLCSKCLSWYFANSSTFLSNADLRSVEEDRVNLFELSSSFEERNSAVSCLSFAVADLWFSLAASSDSFSARSRASFTCSSPVFPTTISNGRQITKNQRQKTS